MQRCLKVFLLKGQSTFTDSLRSNRNKTMAILWYRHCFIRLHFQQISFVDRSRQNSLYN